MKYIKILSSLLFVIFTHTSCTQRSEVSVKLIDPLEKVFPETVIPKDSFFEIDVAKGEVAAVQVVLRSNADVADVQVSAKVVGEDSQQLVADIGAIGYVRASREYTNQAVDKLVSNSGFYPDPIVDDGQISLEAGMTQSLYVSIPIKADTKHGKYEVQLNVTAGSKHIRKSFVINVHDVVLAKQSLWVTNWFSLAPERLKLLNGGDDVEKYSETYWSIVKVLAEKMAAYGQNMALISPLDLASYKLDQGKLSIGFENFDKMVNIFEEAGVIGRIEGGHIGGREGDWDSHFVVRIPDLQSLQSKSIKFNKVSIKAPEAQEFYTKFFTALNEHLAKRGWLDKYYQHIADEPTSYNKESYIEIASFVKKIMPSVKIMEAVHNKDLAETIDLWVPQLDFMDKDFDFYKERERLGDEAWFYTCLSPRGNYANRFIDLPLIKTRLLHWINYKYAIKGYLHWGLNYWNDDPFYETTGINREGGNILPTGDSWIVYPGNHKVYSSIRLEAMRDGLNDYTLLSMLEQVNPALAKAVIDNMIFRFDWYDTSVHNFRRVRKEILTALKK